ncbi:hypothetical protein EDB83DRAFT_1537010 [Lactarius deliciosus]|nr:hypothetical protein EDB83DRAFT_1537010 [Lactarius deliciosus]
MSAPVLTRAQFLSYAACLFQSPSVWPALDLMVFETPLTEDIANDGRLSSVCGEYLRSYFANVHLCSCFAPSHNQTWQLIIYTAPVRDEKVSQVTDLISRWIRTSLFLSPPYPVGRISRRVRV